MSVEELLRSRIRREGPLRFSDVVRIALYGESGFYATGHGAGHRRDFVTSPEVGALFGTLIASQLDVWWNGLGRPDPFLVADCGAGPGTLAVSVLAARPECAPALRLVLVESSVAFREAHRQRRLPLVDTNEFLGSVDSRATRTAMGNASTDDEFDAHRIEGTGPLCASVEHLPQHEFHVILANELLDNLPFDVVQRTATGWSETRVADDEHGLRTVQVPATRELVELAGAKAPDAVVGDTIPVLVDARSWLADSLAQLVRGGRIVCIDYGASTHELAKRGSGWLRTYRGHVRGHDPLSGLGACDITIDVPFDQLSPRPELTMSQAEFLRTAGLDHLVAEAEATWREHASSGNLLALKAKSVGYEASVLCDPSALGAFSVLQWTKP